MTVVNIFSDNQDPQTCPAKWSRAQLFDHCSRPHAAAANRASRQSDTNAAQQTTGLDCYVNVLLFK